MNPERLGGDLGEPEQMQESEMWDLLHSMQEQVEQMRRELIAWREKDRTFLETQAHMSEETNALERAYMERYKDRPVLLEKVSEAIVAMREAERQYALTHAEQVETFAGYEEAIKDLELAVEDLQTVLRKSRN